MLRAVLGLARPVTRRLARRRQAQRWASLRALGMQIGRNVGLPASTWIDESHCFLISIGDDSSFGEGCGILAHDAQMNEFLGAARVGRVVVHPSSHIGAGTLILPGVEIGPRTIVSAGSVVSRSLPADTFCFGSPARAVSSLQEYLDRHRRAIESRPRFDWAEVRDIRLLSPERKAAMLASLSDGDGYIVAEPHYTRLRDAAQRGVSLPTAGGDRAT